MPQAAWVVLGSVSLGAGVLGLFLPLVPTVPFVLLAAWCWSKGSRRLHDWLLRHPRLGPSLHAWQVHGAVSRRAKLMASLTISASLAYPLASDALAWPTRLAAVALGAAVIGFLATRPTPAGGGAEPGAAGPRAPGEVGRARPDGA